VITVDVELPEAASNIEVTDSTGRTVPSQLLSMASDTHSVRFLMQASVPELGYATFFVKPAQSQPQPISALKATPDSLENEFIRVKIELSSGCITIVYKKRHQHNALAPAETDTGGPKNSVCGNLLQTFVDKPKEYDAWNIDADFEDHHWDLDKADEVKLVE